MIARARQLLRAYVAAIVLLAIIALSFVAGFWSATIMAAGMIRAALS